MNDPSISNPAYQALTDQQLSVIDELCDRFDRELVKGDGPRIETFLAEAPESARDGLLAELLAMEIEYRSEQGDAPQRGEFIPRFPEQATIISGAFAREATTQFPGNVSTSTRVSVPPEIGNFRVIEEIGHGGMGVVLKAHDKKLKRDVAIKVLAPHLAADVEAAQRFLREAQSAAAVRHDNVVTIHAVDDANGIPFLVMELINGGSLQDRMKRGPLPADTIVQFGIQIASGLDVAHRRGLIHRDIKPANVLLERQNEPGNPDKVRVKITDFGLARVMSESAMTRSGFIAGTPQYMSPEQANGKPLDHRSDLFSLGSVLYSLCTGQAAFHAESAIAVLWRVTDHVPEPIRSLNPAIPDWLCEVIAKLMAKQPEDRIQSAREVADLLTRCQAPSRETRDGQTMAHTLPSRQRVPRDASSLENSRTTERLPASSIAPQGSSRGPMTPTWNRTLIAVALLAGVVLAVVFSRGRDPRPTDLDLTTTNPSVRPQAEGVSHEPAKVPPRAIAPFNAKQAQQHQEAWAAHLKLPVEITNSIGMKFRLIPPGQFLMGSTPEEIETELKRPGLYPHLHFWRTQIESEGPQHKVVLTKPIYVGVTEVTQSQYEQVMGTNPSQFSATGQGKEAVANLETGNYPVELVSCNESAEFCAKLSQQEKLKPFNVRSGQTVTSLEGTGYRLPTEAEWEFACRAGTTTRFWSGDENEDLIQAGWCVSNYGGRTHAASELKANPFGLSDMHGNVWEWVQDGWDPKFYGQFQENVATDPFCPLSAGTMPMRRGGSIAQIPELVRSSSRLCYHTYAEAGFRVVLVADAVKELLAKSEANAPSPAVAPFDETQARAHQEKWAMHLGVPVEYENSIGMKFRLVPLGEFLMGSTPEEIEAALKVAAYPDWREKIVSEGPQHKVIFTKPIYVGATEVTQSQYKQVMGTNPSFFSATGNGKEAVANVETGNHPVETVSWYDATDFCVRLSQQQKLKPFYFHSDETVTSMQGTGYRLPTEAEWEYACRAGTTTRFWSGDQERDLFQAGRFVRNSGGRTHRVGELKANPFGLADVHGNVWEWVEDSWDPTFYAQFQETAAIDPSASPSSPLSGDFRRVFRGGNWNSSPSECRASFHLTLHPSSRPNYTGFRVVLTVDAVKELLGKLEGNAPPSAVAPFDEKQAQTHQQAWAGHLGVPVEYTNSIGMKFRLIPPGEFLMGSTPEEIEAAFKVADSRWREHIQSEGPQHKVVLTKPIYVGVTEVTQTQYEQVMENNPSHFSATGKGKDLVANMPTGDHPVEMVSWYDAAEFCVKLSQHEKLKPFYFRSDESVTLLEGTGYRLPTEAEWEYACRAGTTTRFWNGDQDQDLISAGWFSGNAGSRTHAASESKSNPFGFSDMHGNVWEWVQDGWDPAFYSQFQNDVSIDPSSPVLVGQNPRPIRGGDWHSNPFECRSAQRLKSWPNWQRDNIGFRVVLVADVVKKLLSENLTPDRAVSIVEQLKLAHIVDE